jgi:predicted nuclease of predicted toxin-antitoxin system
MRFLADVNVSRHVVERLKSQGYSVIRVPEIMDPRTPDQEIISEARQRGAIVISFDQDFGAILAISGATTPSLVNLRVTYVDADRLAKAIVAVVRMTETDLLAGAVVTLADTGVRVHRLPLI